MAIADGTSQCLRIMISGAEFDLEDQSALFSRGGVGHIPFLVNLTALSEYLRGNEEECGA